MAKYKLVLCKNKMDYTTMYSVKDLDSCMYIGNNWLNGKAIHDKWRELATKGMYPGALLHWCPEVKGMYLMDPDGTPVARTFVLINNKGKPTHHLEIRCANANSVGDLDDYYVNLHYARMVTMLKDADINKGDYLQPTKSFKVPGYKYNNKWLMPMPNIDNVYLDCMSVSFDIKTKTFLMSCKSPPKKGEYVDDSYRWKGYVVADAEGNLRPFA